MKSSAKLTSIKAVPVKIEIQPIDHQTDKVLSPEELQEQIEEARKGRAKVDSKYVGNAQGLKHLFEYKYDYARFLDNMSYIIKKGKDGKN